MRGKWVLPALAVVVLQTSCFDFSGYRRTSESADAGDPPDGGSASPESICGTGFSRGNPGRDACLSQNCCDQFLACVGDPACKACLQSSADPGCAENVLGKNWRECEEARCSCGPEHGGPLLVMLPQGYCIDATEVTRAQYAAWLDTNPQTLSQPPQCSWNDSFEPLCEWPLEGKGNHPVVCVDWCDAFAYCQGVGKRLCGKIGGGANGFYDVDNASTSQWYSACSMAGVRDYPYGDTYEDAACHGRKNDPETTIEVGDLASCQSYLGVFDLSGNVWEWEDACADSIGRFDECRVRGGGFDSDGRMRCDVVTMTKTNRFLAAPNLGFRCCAL
jgi:sulfatase modifying factor 1